MPVKIRITVTVTPNETDPDTVHCLECYLSDEHLSGNVETPAQAVKRQLQHSVLTMSEFLLKDFKLASMHRTRPGSRLN